MIHLDDDTIDQLLDLASVTETVGEAFAAWGRGEAQTTQRVRAAVPGAMASAMAAVVPPFSGGKVYATLCTRGDLINLPANLTHWFDMGPSPSFKAIRLFTTPDGWVGNFTGSDIADRFPRYENAA